jgi:hypothetical protein
MRTTQYSKFKKQTVKLIGQKSIGKNQMAKGKSQNSNRNRQMLKLKGQKQNGRTQIAKGKW